ncbi:MAG: FixH family protein [Crocinitomicaceae bacterium]
MKFNWGHGITIAIIAFISFIVYIVIQTFSLNADLIQDDFYEEEIRTNEKKLMGQNYDKLSNKIQIKKAEEGVLILFPTELKNASGKIQFYRRDDKRLDKFFSIQMDSLNIQQLKYDEFLKGSYDIKIECEKDKTKYLHQTTILF